MNKEDILARSRAEQNDEGMRDAEEKGRRIGIRAFCLVELIVLIFNYCTDQPTYVPMSMFWAFTAAEGKQALYLLLEYRFEFIACVLLSIPVVPWLSRKLEGRPWLEPARMLPALGVFALSLLSLVSTTFNPFIYFRF